MNTALSAKRVFLFLLLLLAGVSLAHAQATRTWVSGVGDDANPCSRTAPCKTFAGAISKTATGGIINALDPGGFGAVTITKSITLESNGELASILASGVNGIIVNATANDTVVLRGISIDGAGTTLGTNGVRFLNGAKLVIEHCTIQNFSGNGVDFQPSGNAKLVMNETTVNNITGSAVFVKGGAASTSSSVTAALDKVKLLQSGFGLQVNKGVASIKDSTVSGNTSVGVKALGPTAPDIARISVDDSLISDNPGTGINAQGTQGKVFVSRSTLTANGTGISGLLSGTTTSFGNNRIFGNISSDGSPTSTTNEQ